MDLPGWMPKPIGSDPFTTRYRNDFGEAIVEHILRVMDDHVVFTCKFMGRRVDFDFSISDRTTSEKVAEILRSNREKSLGSISTIELRADEKPA
jgi:hypothetical protein